MKKSINIIITIWVIAIIATAFIVWKSCENKQVYNIKIACNLPITGDLATYGESVRDGMILAQSDLKASDPDFAIGIDFQDNVSKPNTAITIFNKQKLNKNDVYVSGVKPQTMSIIDEVEKLGIPHFTWIFDAFVTRDYANAYRSWVNYRVESEYIKKFFDTKQSKKVAIVYVQLPHTDELVNKILIPYFKEKGINYSIEPYDIEKKDFKDIATKVKNLNPDAVYVNGFKANLIGLVKAFEDYEINTSCDNLYTYDFMDAINDFNDEIISHINYVVPAYELDKSDLKAQWQKRFIEKFHRNPRYTDAYAYDMMYAIYRASKANKNIKDVSFDGVTGKVDFDETGDIITKLYIINRTKEGINYVVQ